MIRKIVVFTLLALVSFACEKESDTISDLKLVSFRPNQCSEPWDLEKYNSPGEISRENRLKNYLKEKGITTITNFEAVTSDSGSYCKACTCPDNHVFKFTVTLQDYTKLKNIEPFSTYLS